MSHDGGLNFGRPTIIQLDGVDARRQPHADEVLQRQGVDRRRPAARHGLRELDPVHLQQRRQLPGVADHGRRARPTSGGTGRRRSGCSPRWPASPAGITPFAPGSNPQVGNDGTLYIAYETSVCATLACDAADDHDAIVVASSTDRGRTFSTRDRRHQLRLPVTSHR